MSGTNTQSYTQDSEDSIMSKYWLQKNEHLLEMTKSKARFQQFQKEANLKTHHQNSPERKERTPSNPETSRIQLADRKGSKEML